MATIQEEVPKMADIPPFPFQAPAAVSESVLLAEVFSALAPHQRHTQLSSKILLCTALRLLRRMAVWHNAAPLSMCSGSGASATRSKARIPIIFAQSLLE